MEAEEHKRAWDTVNSWRDPSLIEGAAASVSRGGAVVFETRPSPPVAGQPVEVRFQAEGGPLAGSDDGVTLHAGHNDWLGKQSVPMRRLGEGGEAWVAELTVPQEATVLEAVFSNTAADTWDNNDQNDFRAPVALPAGEHEDQWWEARAEDLRGELRAARLEEERAEAVRESERQEARREALEYSKLVKRRQMRHLVFTEPAEPRAGDDVRIFYNAEAGGLGTPERVYLDGSFNRWDHPYALSGVEMALEETSGGERRWSATVSVPADAYMMDFVFRTGLEPEAQVDNHHGLDYHVPVEGDVKSPPLHICHIAVEMAPIAKVGGLGDVVTALARCVKERGHLTEIVLPRYDFLLGSPLLGAMEYETEFDWGGCKIFVSRCVVEGIQVFFIEPSNGMFKVDSVYGRYTDNECFDFFSKAALEFLLQTGRQPDILHCHDWSSAEVARAYWNDYHNYGLHKPKVVFTIHNLNYGAAKIAEAAQHSQRFTTVSPSYAGEVADHPSINPNLDKFVGIRNGIDTEIWDPSNDPFLPRGFSHKTVVEGKASARQALRERVGLNRDTDCPVIGIVSRLTHQKGIHLIKHAAHRALDRGCQFVLLGSAPDPKIQEEFNEMARHMDSSAAAFVFTYDEPLSHLIYAGCDMICVPSMFEPCGLTQMIAMRYGSVPVVRETGGLRDTVFDVDHGKGRGAWVVHGSADPEGDGVDGTNGYSFEGTDEGSMDYALNRAIDYLSLIHI